jgi:hypothetical protein
VTTYAIEHFLDRVMKAPKPTGKDQTRLAYKNEERKTKN